MIETLTNQQLQFLQHSLGCDQYGRGSMFRNRFVTGESCDSYSVCLQLVAMGLMSNHGPKTLFGGMSVFYVTAKGKDVMRSQSPEPPPPEKLSRGKRRYREFLDADCGYSFREWMGFKNERRRKI